MFPFSNTGECLIELDRLGFGYTEITADYMSVQAVTYQKETGVYLRMPAGTIESALMGLVSLAIAYNGFPENTKHMIRKQQAEERELFRKTYNEGRDKS